MVLGDAFSDPHQITNLLLFELEKGVKDAIVELRVKGEFVQLHFMVEEAVLHRAFNLTDATKGGLEELAVLL